MFGASLHVHSHLNIVWYIQLSRGRWEQGRDVYTKQAGN